MKKVLLIDSGSGGVNVLKECVEVCPKCDYLLFCDDKNLPYGTKTKDELIKLTFQNLENIKIFFNFEIVIFACNTLSCTVLESCRERFKDVTFIGTVPAIKPALLKYSPQDILVLSTPVTAEHNILISKNPQVQVVAMPTLATLIDENLDDLSRLAPMLEKALEGYSPKALVLGCTHYFAVKDIFQKIFEGAEIFDSANGVARRLASLVNEDEKNCQVQIMTSKNDSMLASFWFHYFKF